MDYLASFVQFAVIIAIIIFILRGCNQQPIIYPKPETITRTVIQYDTIIQSKIIEKKVPVIIYSKSGKHSVDSIVFNTVDSSGLFRGIIKNDTASIQFSIIDTAINIRQTDTISQIIIQDPKFQLSAGLLAGSSPVPVVGAKFRSCTVLAGYDIKESRPMFGIMIPVRIFGIPKRSKANWDGNTQRIDPDGKPSGSVISADDERSQIKNI